MRHRSAVVVHRRLVAGAVRHQVLRVAAACGAATTETSAISTAAITLTTDSRYQRVYVHTVDRFGRVKLTNPDKVLYPATGTTKAEVFDYYVNVAAAMVPHIAGRACTRKRWPNGVEESSFFEKQLASSARTGWSAGRSRTSPAPPPIRSSTAPRLGVDRAAGVAGSACAAMAFRQDVEPRRRRRADAGTGHPRGVRSGPPVKGGSRSGSLRGGTRGP